MYRALRWALLALFAVFASGCQSDPPLSVVHVDLQQMQGKWYEIASLPRPTQAGCTGTTAQYQLKSANELLVVNECHMGNLNGPVNRVAARAVANDPDTPAKLSLDFGFAYGDYWVIDVGEQYEYLVVGHPSRDYLWILSREPSLPSATLDAVIARAKANGFPVGILSYTKQ
ncbi:MAG TPA: lipocalin family protein [Polyangiaceae bacterium]|jgi:apolipoprotein D and lipocalin family protein|nr:lipocalin family protein [Polyangiaceae bacterium]